MFLSGLSNLFSKQKYIKIKTFTYYLPSPPERKTGYQEKEFDQITSYLIGKNFDILDFKMQACQSNKSSGMWVICLLGAKTKSAAQMNLAIDYNEIAHLVDSNIKLDPSIEHEH